MRRETEQTVTPEAMKTRSVGRPGNLLARVITLGPGRHHQRFATLSPGQRA